VLAALEIVYHASERRVNPFAVNAPNSGSSIYGLS
jgi:hypothetical protein